MLDHGLVSSLPFIITTTLLIVLSVAVVGSQLLLLRHCLHRADQRTDADVEKIRNFGRALVEPLIVSDGEKIVFANESLQRLVGRTELELSQTSLAELLPEILPPDRRLQDGRTIRKAMLLPGHGEPVQVEASMQTVQFGRIQYCVVSMRDVQDRRNSYSDTDHVANTDPLTGLPNRLSFSARLKEELAAHTQKGQEAILAILYLDLDRFKQVNDLFGHAAGDEQLRRVAMRITSVLRKGQMLARLGGDEFAIIAPDLPDAKAASRIAENILAALRGDTLASPGKPPISASIGIALCPFDGTDEETLLGHADIALYRVKEQGRDNLCFFKPKMGAEVRDRRALERDLRQAITRGELRIEYQPQVRLRTGEAIGFEALLRWRHAERGEIAPSLFIPIAEDTCSILEIGNWVLLEACAEAARWSKPLSLSVNVSAIQLHDVHFPRQVHEALINTGLPPSRLELEITETALVKDLDRAIAALRQIKSLGVRIAIDDFGVGLSSFAYLRSFPFDLIKIDQSLVRSVETDYKAVAIIRAVLGLGRDLGLPVLAEGIEADNELRFLEAEMCDAAQGFHIGAPDQVTAFRHLTHPDERACDQAALPAVQRRCS